MPISDFLRSGKTVSVTKNEYLALNNIKFLFFVVKSFVFFYQEFWNYYYPAFSSHKYEAHVFAKIDFYWWLIFSQNMR